MLSPTTKMYVFGQIKINLKLNWKKTLYELRWQGLDRKALLHLSKWFREIKNWIKARQNIHWKLDLTLKGRCNSIGHCDSTFCPYIKLWTSKNSMKGKQHLKSDMVSKPHFKTRRLFQGLGIMRLIHWSTNNSKWFYFQRLVCVCKNKHQMCAETKLDQTE